MRHWDEVFLGQILRNRYEDLVSDQERQSRRLIEHLGLPWDDACLEVFRQGRSGRHVQLLAGPVADLQFVDEPLEELNYGSSIEPLIEALGDLAGN